MRLAAFSGLAGDRVAVIRDSNMFQQTASLQSARMTASSRRAARRIVSMARKLSVGDLDKSQLEGKRVLVRADLNVPLKDGKITDDTRVRAAIPTLKYLVDNGARVLLTSHLVRCSGRFRAHPLALLPMHARQSTKSTASGATPQLSCAAVGPWWDKNACQHAGLDAAPPCCLGRCPADGSSLTRPMLITVQMFVLFNNMLSRSDM